MKKLCMFKRTNIELDTAKVAKAKKISGLKSSKDVVDYALSRLIATSQSLTALDALSGKVKFRKGYDYKAER